MPRFGSDTAPQKKIEIRKFQIAFKRPIVKRTILKLFFGARWSGPRKKKKTASAPQHFCSSLTLSFQRLPLLSCCLLLPLFHHLGQLLLGSAPSIHVHQFLVALRLVWRNAAHWCAHSRTLAMASKTPTPPTCTPVAQDPPARRTPGRCFGHPKNTPQCST